MPMNDSSFIQAAQTTEPNAPASWSNITVFVLKHNIGPTDENVFNTRQIACGR